MGRCTREYMKSYMKEYIKHSPVIICEFCEGKYRRYTKSKHIRTQKHLNALVKIKLGLNAGLPDPFGN